MEWYAPSFHHVIECAFTAATVFHARIQISMAYHVDRMSFCIFTVSNVTENSRETTHDEKIYFFFWEGRFFFFAGWPEPSGAGGAGRSPLTNMASMSDAMLIGYLRPGGSLLA
jgi:hypothetical protein